MFETVLAFLIIYLPGSSQVTNLHYFSTILSYPHCYKLLDTAGTAAGPAVSTLVAARLRLLAGADSVRGAPQGDHKETSNGLDRPGDAVLKYFVQDTLVSNTFQYETDPVHSIVLF